MESWLPFFVIVASLAVVVQAVTLTAIYLYLRRQGQRMEMTLQELHSGVTPILARIQVLMDDVNPQISNMIADAAHITHLARTQVQHADRVVGETVERLRLQLVHADQILTGALETVEGAGMKLRRTVWGPVQSVSALVRGIQVGLEVFRGNRRRGDVAPSETQDESLFI